MADNGNGQIALKQSPQDMPEDVLVRSVTKGDIAQYIGAGMVQFLIPAFGGSYLIGQLPPELPPIASLTPYNKARDTILVMTPRVEGMWASAIHIAVSKLVSRGIQFEGPVSRRVDLMNELFRICDGRRGFATFLERHLQDFFTCSQGAWVEIERVKRDPGAKIVSFHHLDSLRVWRTGDPEIPAVYWDLRGAYHELNWWEVFNVTDLESSRAGWWYGGECAAERAYHDIRAVALMSTYFDEKISGGGANKIVFVPGLNDQQLKDAITAAEQEKLSKGVVYYQGVYFVPLFGDQKIETTEVDTKGMPDGWDRKIEDQLRLLRYAKALGIVPQDLDPQLTARGSLGVGAQAQILDENEKGYGFGTWEKKFLNHINNLITPEATTATLVTIDLRDQDQKAKIALTRAQARAAMRGNANAPGELNPQQSLYMAIQDEDAPREFLSENAPAEETVTDQQKPMSENEESKIADDYSKSVNQQGAAQGLATGKPMNQGQPIETKEVKDAPNLRHSDNVTQRCDNCRFARNISEVWYCRPYDFPTKDDWVCDAWAIPNRSAPDEPPATIKQVKGKWVSKDLRPAIFISSEMATIKARKRNPLIDSEIERARQLYRQAREKVK